MSALADHEDNVADLLEVFLDTPLADGLITTDFSADHIKAVNRSRMADLLASGQLSGGEQALLAVCFAILMGRSYPNRDFVVDMARITGGAKFAANLVVLNWLLGQTNTASQN